MSYITPMAAIILQQPNMPNFIFNNKELEVFFGTDPKDHYSLEKVISVTYGNCKKCKRVGPIDTVCFVCYDDYIELNQRMKDLGQKKELFNIPYFRAWLYVDDNDKHLIKEYKKNDLSPTFWAPHKLAQKAGMMATPTQGYIMEYNLETSKELFTSENKPPMMAFHVEKDGLEIHVDEDCILNADLGFSGER